MGSSNVFLKHVSEKGCENMAMPEMVNLNNLLRIIWADQGHAQ